MDHNSFWREFLLECQNEENDELMALEEEIPAAQNTNHGSDQDDMNSDDEFVQQATVKERKYQQVFTNLQCNKQHNSCRLNLSRFLDWIIEHNV